MPFAFENVSGSFLNTYTTIFVPTVSCFFARFLQEGYFPYCTPSPSLPPSKIKDFCHLPRQREVFVGGQFLSFGVGTTEPSPCPCVSSRNSSYFFIRRMSPGMLMIISPIISMIHSIGRPTPRIRQKIINRRNSTSSTNETTINM